MSRVLMWVCLSAALSAADVQGQNGEGQERADHDEQKVILVTAQRLASEAREVASAYTVITREQIERKQSVFVADLLREVPGLDVTPNGGPGQQAAVLIRGAKSEHTLVLIDGIEANDPITPGRTFDIGALTTENIERIEIIRGPQSTLYGSDAIGGVINIVTRRGRGKPTVYGLVEGGSFGTFRQEAGIHGGTGLVNYSLALRHTDTGGVSAAWDKLPGNREEDGFASTSFSARVGLSPADNFSIDLFLRHGATDADIDDSGGAYGDDVNRDLDTEFTYARLQATLSLFEDRWEQTIGVSASDQQRRDDDDPDEAHPDEFYRSELNSRLLKFDWQHNLHLVDNERWQNTLTLGVETEQERGDSRLFSDGPFGPYASVFDEEKARTTGWYVQDKIGIHDSFFATVGLRLDDHDEFGTHVTYRIAPAYLIKSTGTKLKATYGTGFKAPTLFQLFSSFGDPDLDPEKSKGWDAGIEQKLWSGRATVGAAYFQNKFDDMIDFDDVTFTYSNVDRAETRGVEVFAAANPLANLAVRGSYTYTHSEDERTNQDLIRRPNNKASLDVNYRFLDRKAQIGVGVDYIGKRDDLDFAAYTGARVELDSYTLVGINARYKASEFVEVFARAENLFDEDYEPVSGFGAPGRAFFGGLKIRF